MTIEKDIERLERKLVDLQKLYERNYRNYEDEYQAMGDLLVRSRQMRKDLQDISLNMSPEKLDAILKISEILNNLKAY